MLWFIYITSILLVISLNLRETRGTPQVPCFFIFGDSLSDCGNNNGLKTLVKADYPPYGIDFPGGPTGRFTNGKTSIDIIGELLGLEGYIPPMLAATDSMIAKGVNYASGSAGIRHETGSKWGDRICMNLQLQNHKEVVAKIGNLMKNGSASHLNKCLYSVNIGSNDWMLNYYSSGEGQQSKPSPEAFAGELIDQLSQQLTTLYEMGARKVILFGVGPLGCLPPLNTNGACTPSINGVLEMYNTKLKSLSENLNTKYNDAKFIWIDSIAIDSIDLRGLGLRVTNVACCKLVQGGACQPASIPCSSRGEYAYWDNAHPTEAANRVLANRAFKALQATDASPMDISKLAQLNL